jgi:VIT1/CCC1 family predicted Fe2+/Mn2+ transporter
VPEPEQVDTRPEPPAFEGHHRDVKGGAARAAVFGVSDGLVSNTGLILAMAGADPGADVVRLAGLGGLIAGAISMAAGEYNSMKVQAELLERELDLERREHVRNPHVETVELAQIYQSRGVEPDAARDLAEAMMANPDLALQAHAREELGIDPGSLGSPIGAAVSSFVAFCIGAVIPLGPWFVAAGTAAVVASLVLAVLGALVVGVVTARLTDRPAVRVAGRQLAFVLGPALLAYAVGAAVGVGV